MKKADLFPGLPFVAPRQFHTVIPICPLVGSGLGTVLSAISPRWVFSDGEKGNSGLGGEAFLAILAMEMLTGGSLARALSCN